MEPKDQDQLMKFTLAAKKVIYDADRMRGFLQMLGTQPGALQAVHSVISIIEKFKPIPPNIAPLLGVNIYMIMVDVAQTVTKHKADPEILKAVIQSILSSTKQQPKTPQQTQQPAGMIAQQGVPA